VENAACRKGVHPGMGKIFFDVRNGSNARKELNFRNENQLNSQFVSYLCFIRDKT
jgi:hypothetical protein